MSDALDMMPLPLIGELTVTSCEGCGRCCEHVGAPCGYAGAFLADGPLPRWLEQSEDGRRLREMPAEAWLELAAYYFQRRQSLRHIDYDDTACFWLDPVTKACRHYEWRPSVCRDFPMSHALCIAARTGLVRVGGGLVADDRYQTEASWRGEGGDCAA